MGRPIFDVLSHAKGLGFEALLDNVRLTGEPFKGSALAAPLERNGVLETVYLDFVYEPFRENDGTISGVIAVAIEVTEEVRARKQIAEAEERARLAVDAVGLGTFDLDLISGEMITSTLFANMFDFEEPARRSEYVAVFHPDDMPIREKAHKDAVTSGRLSYEARVIWKDKSVHWLRVEGKVFYDSEKAVRILGTLLDTTEQKRAREEQLAAKQALADNEEFLRNITTAAPATLWTSDENGNINYVNQAWIDWTGRSYEENLGAGWVESIAREDRQKVIDAWTKSFSGRTRYEVEFRINHSDGSIHWCVVTGKPQYRADGSFVGYTGACVDITEQKLLQQQKDDFIGIASHELKTPVTSIKAYTQVLEKMLLKRGETKEAAMISRMDAQINRLTSLIADLLDVTKINSGKLQFNDDEFDFNLMVKDLVEDLQRTTDKHKLIENYTNTAVVYGDKERIGQVITNLITNAIKYSPHADKIKISTSLKDNEVQLCVEDYGIGISKDKLGKVFEQFYRVSGDMQHTFPGLGLGLYISSEIIKREGGRIWVTSEEGKGSTFGFGLPLTKHKQGSKKENG